MRDSSESVDFVLLRLLQRIKLGMKLVLFIADLITQQVRTTKTSHNLNNSITTNNSPQPQQPQLQPQQLQQPETTHKIALHKSTHLHK